MTWYIYHWILVSDKISHHNSLSQKLTKRIGSTQIVVMTMMAASTATVVTFLFMFVSITLCQDITDGSGYTIQNVSSESSTKSLTATLNLINSTTVNGTDIPQLTLTVRYIFTIFSIITNKYISRYNIL